MYQKGQRHEKSAGERKRFVTPPDHGSDIRANRHFKSNPELTNRVSCHLRNSEVDYDEIFTTTMIMQQHHPQTFDRSNFLGVISSPKWYNTQNVMMETIIDVIKPKA